MISPRTGAHATLAVWLTLLASVPAAAEAPDRWEAVGQSAAERLVEYLRIDTTNPPGRTVEAAAFLERELRAAGIAVERTGPDPQKPILIGRLGGTGRAKPVVLLNHMDVVAANRDRWSFPPFSGDLVDGEIRGRGAIDMKGFGVVQLMALRLLAARAERLDHDILFVAVPDEEVGGGAGMKWLAEKRPDILDAAAVWGEGGVGLADAFAVPVLLIAVAEKQVLWLRLVAEGPAGHGSLPLAGSAPRRLVDALGRVMAEPPAPRLTPIVREMFLRIGSVQGGMEGFAMRRLKNPVVWLFSDGLLQQSPLASALVRDTVALTVLNAGASANVVPGRAEAVLDCRLLPDTDEERFLQDLRKKIADPSIRIEIVQPPEPAASSSLDDPLFEAISTAAARVYPEAVAVPYLAPLATDLRFFRRRGVPAYGFMPFLLSSDLYATAHGSDERLPAATLGPAVRVVYEALSMPTSK
jgi:acetylornithine deacetylase/succinyl-diaminopimelate desuccinylase-like protein